MLVTFPEQLGFFQKYLKKCKINLVPGTTTFLNHRAGQDKSVKLSCTVGKDERSYTAQQAFGLVCKVHTNIFSKRVDTAEKVHGQVTLKFEQIFAKPAWLITIKQILV